MSAKTSRILNAKEFSDVIYKTALRSSTRQHLKVDPAYAMDLPGEVDLQLTYKCNLRCTHCYQWNDNGFFRDFDSATQRKELDISIVTSILKTTAASRAKLYMWGGEPMMHSKFGAIMDLLHEYPRVTTICTNGLLFQRHLNHLLGLEDLNLLVSLDGLREDHDAMRGKGTFDRTERNIRNVVNLKKSGEYLGEISLTCMVSHTTVQHMYEFLIWAEQLGVNSVYFQFPWYISPQVAEAMDKLYEECFQWLPQDTGTRRRTWHSYSYRLPPELIPVLHNSMTRIADRTWNLRVRYQPELEEDEIAGFILGHERPGQRKSQCLAVSNRMEVHADGKVTSCKFFPEFAVGNLYDMSVEELWRGPTFRKVRMILAENGMMPVCSRCILLYTNGI